MPSSADIKIFSAEGKEMTNNTVVDEQTAEAIDELINLGSKLTFDGRCTYDVMWRIVSLTTMVVAMAMVVVSHGRPWVASWVGHESAMRRPWVASWVSHQSVMIRSWVGHESVMSRVMSRSWVSHESAMSRVMSRSWVACAMWSQKMLWLSITLRYYSVLYSVHYLHVVWYGSESWTPLK